MEKTSFKKCTNPKCQSEDVFWNGDLGMGKGAEINSPATGKYTQPNCPIYECRKCGERFLLIEKEQ